MRWSAEVSHLPRGETACQSPPRHIGLFIFPISADPQASLFNPSVGSENIVTYMTDSQVGWVGCSILAIFIHS